MVLSRFLFSVLLGKLIQYLTLLEIYLQNISLMEKIKKPDAEKQHRVPIVLARHFTTTNSV